MTIKSRGNVPLAIGIEIFLGIVFIGAMLCLRNGISVFDLDPIEKKKIKIIPNRSS